jgi:hypothetical protein
MLLVIHLHRAARHGHGRCIGRGLDGKGRAFDHGSQERRLHGEMLDIAGFRVNPDKALVIVDGGEAGMIVDLGRRVGSKLDSLGAANQGDAAIGGALDDPVIGDNAAAQQLHPSAVFQCEDPTAQAHGSPVVSHGG